VIEFVFEPCKKGHVVLILLYYRLVLNTHSIVKSNGIGVVMQLFCPDLTVLVSLRAIPETYPTSSLSCGQNASVLKPKV
jgi:hypothetical protein